MSFRNLITLLPVLLLFGCFLSLNTVSQFSTDWLNTTTVALPLLSFAAALLLSLQFNRSRLSYALLFIGFNALLLLADDLPASLPGLRAALSQISSDQRLNLQLLFSLNLFIFSGFKDRGFFSIHSIIRLSFLALQLAALSLLPLPLIENTLAPLAANLPTSISQSHLFQQTPLILLASFTLMLCLQSLSLVIRKSSLDITFIALHCILISFHMRPDSGIFIPLLMIVAAIIIISSILMDSHAMAYRDELTGLPSRRALTQLQLSLGRKYTIAMLDIDFFKKFNDTHGHDIGDEVLKMVASQIGKVGGGGRAFRYGGEEFTVVFPGKDPEHALEHCEALRENIQNYAMALRTPQRPQKSIKNRPNNAKRSKNTRKMQSLSVTISIGLAQRDGTLKTPVQVMKGADQALYRAKKKCRNCVMT
ncbi:MAG: GGDEF domain-containing protein [Pseudomonadales bacterium]|nr:GGDEF domain-containing protein [Pseudomonadales bacterium]